MVIPWSCGTCGAKFDYPEELRAHRAEAHPDLEAGAIAHKQVMDNGGTEEEADDAEFRAVKEYRERVAR